MSDAPERFELDTPNGRKRFVSAEDYAALQAQLEEWKESQHYRYIGKDGKPVLARDLEAALAAERAKVAALVEAIRPYADFAKDRAVDAPEWTDKDHIQVLISIGDLRALASALPHTKQQRGER